VDGSHDDVLSFEEGDASIVIASEAKQSRSQENTDWIASSLRSSQ
jgi:hypothetical protein